MTIAHHYDDEALIALLERAGSNAAAGDEHVSSCPVCQEAVVAYSSMMACLREASVWQRPLVTEPVPETIAVLRAFAGTCRSEDEAGALLVDELTAGGREEWMPRLQADARYRTAGVVRILCTRAEEMSGKSPADELAMTELATDVAEHLDPAKYSAETIARVRGNAWRNRAYALDYTGDLNAALAAVTRAKQQYDLLPVADYDLARLELTRALILRHLDRIDEGLSAVRNAVGPLEAAAEVRRLRVARTIEAAMRRRAGDIRAALQIWLELSCELPADDETRAGVLGNIAVCYRELGDLETALDYYRQSLEATSPSEPSGERERRRWNIGSILLRQQRFVDAETVLSSVVRRFTELVMREEVVLARLELAELFIVQERYDEAIATCAEVIAELRTSGLEHTTRALTAVTYLQEATQAKRATGELARSVREFVSEVRTQPALLFAPPPL